MKTEIRPNTFSASLQSEIPGTYCQHPVRPYGERGKIREPIHSDTTLGVLIGEGEKYSRSRRG